MNMEYPYVSNSVSGNNSFVMQSAGNGNLSNLPVIIQNPQALAEEMKIKKLRGILAAEQRSGISQNNTAPQNPQALADHLRDKKRRELNRQSAMDYSTNYQACNYYGQQQPMYYNQPSFQFASFDQSAADIQVTADQMVWYNSNFAFTPTVGATEMPTSSQNAIPQQPNPEPMGHSDAAFFCKFFIEMGKRFARLSADQCREVLDEIRNHLGEHFQFTSLDIIMNMATEIVRRRTK